MNTNLREAESKIYVEGIVSEKRLELEKLENNNELIKGEVIVRTGEFNYVPINVFCYKYKSDGKGGFTTALNKTYKGIETVLNEYKSVAEVGEEEATRVRISGGTLRPNSYKGEDGEIKEIVRYSTNFFNRISDSEINPNAEFECEVYVESISPEIYSTGDNQGEETGRAKIKAWMPTYSGIEPIYFVATDEDGVAEAVMNMFKSGDTVKFYGLLVNNKVVTTKEIPVAIGKPKIETKVTYKNELLITNASESYEDIEGKEPYQTESIRLAIAEREKNLNSSKNQNNNTNSGMKSTKTDRKLPWE